MFQKILIANRGEIACRIIRTARQMNIATVAVYSDADRDGLHVQMADEAVHIGPSQAVHSYLSIEKILAAAKLTAAEAVHPGYGFLSEQVAFAEALRNAGIVFIGPNPKAMAAMGDKIVSKKVASAAGVSTVPGYPDAIDTPDQAISIAQSIGYPVMIKASAGGGGKGMRIARNDSETREGFLRSRSEAASSFGDDRVFVEKYISEPRHIEIQVLGDKHGSVIYLGERECSVQRRHQKVLEEAPSPLLDEQTRETMGRQAVALAKAVAYDSAGTVEFVVGQDKSFYFLEMNTRLQVEHPVTEFVTGIDLVEEMIRVAAGEPLRLQQEDVHLNGWAVEARVYAEDPVQGFLPSTGRLSLFRPPMATCSDAAVRVDTGVEEGSTISVYYDPMIAKLVTHAPTRQAAIDAQLKALNAFSIEGVQNNLSFLSSLMKLPRWLEGRLSTSLIAEEFGSSANIAAPRGTDLKKVVAVSVAVNSRLEQLRDRVRDTRGHLASGRHLVLILEGDMPPEQMHVMAGIEGDTISTRFPDGDTVEVETGWLPPEPTFRGMVDAKAMCCQVRTSSSTIVIEHSGTRLSAQVLTPHAAAMSAFMPKRRRLEGEGIVLAPMPGVIREIQVAAGDKVEVDQPVAVMEAMKMEVTVRAIMPGRVTKIFVRPGANVGSNSPLMTIEA
ncbi:acetyl-CoA carboxylase biotin carboxylase subunit [Mesorhizobium sp. ES1-4]|uniref:acetyl-CoA carboxylase biotin carboxylase subunit n=1 Tax=Mesorhizobium sp. ES1-4 TaxID=2876627 RepID=UPI001CCE9D42|nr:acetyl/propionyl/methylcrotonyl-CoA carboxylase subunit alpha [Mesorhizobium sp. ES1-4]MBZ9798430.1 acetyl/propionyl/methylcrotonyl-CoA carboxylase subunit alpha [Mesorhizobium sp. ES1-4]